MFIVIIIWLFTIECTVLIDMSNWAIYQDGRLNNLLHIIFLSDLTKVLHMSITKKTSCKHFLTINFLYNELWRTFWKLVLYIPIQSVDCLLCAMQTDPVYAYYTTVGLLSRQWFNLPNGFVWGNFCKSIREDYKN